MERPSARDALNRYDGYLDEPSDASQTIMSKDYTTFRQEALEKKVSAYESLCQLSASLLKVAPNRRERDKLQRAIDVSHLDITPESAASFAAVFSFALILLGLLIGVLAYIASGEMYLFWPLVLIIGGAVLVKPFSKIPYYLESQWRLAASNQMVMCILYVVMYMRHTSNLEHAIKFAGEHVGLPLSLDLKKVLWNVETGNYVTIQESLDAYLQQWKDSNSEFVESFHLIQSSLYEASDSRRVELLEKALQVILDGTYERMLHYAHNLSSPITMLHMFGVILPVLGLVIFPLIGSFMGGAVQWYHLAVLYNVFIPLLVFFYGTKLMKQRPTGYGQGDALKLYPSFKVYQKTDIIASTALILLVGFLVVGFLPLILHIVDPTYDVELLGWKLLDFKDEHGPYGLWSLLLSFFIPLGLAFSAGIYLTAKHKKIIDMTAKTDQLEKEFSSALFQLGTRVGDGVPAEVAIGTVADNLAGSPSGQFFQIVNNNMRRLGMGLREAIFDPSAGGAMFFPSHLIHSSMKILVESSKKGISVVSSSMMTISKYVDRIRQVNERLKDLMAEVSSSMASQIHFMTPVIAGIVVGVGSMVVTIINLLGEQYAALSTEGATPLGGLGGLLSVLQIKDVIPGFQFQAVVGVYVVEMIAILTLLNTAIERGVDSTVAQYRMGKNLMRSTLLYVVVSVISVLIFNLLASAVGNVGIS